MTRNDWFTGFALAGVLMGDPDRDVSVAADDARYYALELSDKMKVQQTDYFEEEILKAVDDAWERNR